MGRKPRKLYSSWLRKQNAFRRGVSFSCLLHLLLAYGCCQWTSCVAIRNAGRGDMACYSDLQMAAALRLAGVSPGDAAYLVATSHPESGGCNVIQQGQPYGLTGWGVWQITPGNSEPQFGINNALLSLWPNAEAAAAKLSSQGLGAWTTITSGAYLPYFSAAKSAVGTVWGLSASQVQSLAKSAGKGGTQAQTTAFNPLAPGQSIVGDVFGNVLNDLANQFHAGSVKDLFIRFGFILLGGLVLLLGIVMLVGRAATTTAINVAVPESKAASASSGSTASAARSSSQQVARSTTP